MKRSFRKLDRSDFQSRVHGINRRALGLPVTPEVDERVVESRFGARTFGFVGALIVVGIATHPETVMEYTGRLDLPVSREEILLGLALGLGLCLAYVVFHLMRLLVLGHRGARSKAVLTGVLVGVIAAQVPIAYYAGAGAKAVDGIERFAGADLSMVTPEEVTRRLNDVLRRW